jgi:hypothetical protein
MASKMVLFILMALGPTLLAAMEGETINEQLRRAVSQVVPTSRVLHGLEIQFVVPPRDLDDIEKLLLLGGDPNFRLHESDRPLLEIALKKDRTDLATMLLERGASFKQVNLWAEGKYRTEYIRSVQWAIEHGLNSVPTAPIYAAFKVLSDQDFDMLGITLVTGKDKHGENFIAIKLKKIVPGKYVRKKTREKTEVVFEDLLKKVFADLKRGYTGSITLSQSQFEELPTPSNEEEIAIVRAVLLFAVSRPDYIYAIRIFIDRLKAVETLPLTLQTALKVAAVTNVPRAVIKNFKVIAKHYKAEDEEWKKAMGEALVLAAAQGNSTPKNNIVGYILDVFGDTLGVTFIQEALERALLAEHHGAAKVIWKWIKEKEIILKEGNWEENWGASLTRILMFAALHGESPRNQFNLFNEVFKYVQEHKVEQVDISAVALFLQVLLREETMRSKPREEIQEKLKNALNMIESFEGEALQRSLTDNLKNTIEYLIGALAWSPLAKGAMVALLGSIKIQSEIK